MALSDGPSRSGRRWTSFISPFLVGLTLCRLCSGQVADDVSEDTDRRFLLLISEMNGKLTALNVLKSGNIVWDFDTKEPLISSTITKLELNESGVLTRLIPGLDGRLYQFDGEMIEPLPLSADNLLDSSVRFHENSFIVGGKELSSFGINPENGQVQYACTSRGCDTQQKNHLMSGGDNLLVLSTSSRTIRAIDMKSGQEKWNFSVGQHELSYISSKPASPGDQDEDSTHTASHVPPSSSTDAPTWDYLSWFRSDSYDMSDMIDIKVIVPKGIVKAVYKSDPSNTLWTHQFGAPIAGAWTLHNHVLEKMSLFDDRHVPALAPVADSEDGDVADVSRHGREEALLYLGMHNNQLYVQPSVRLLRRTQAPPIDALALSLPKVQWRPYLATAPSRTPLLISRTSQQLGWDKQQDSDSTQLTSWHDQYPFDAGYYLLDDQSSAPKTAITHLDNTNSLARYWWQTIALAVVCTVIVSHAIHMAIARYLIGHADRKTLLRMMSFSSETDAPLSGITTTSGSGVQLSPTPSPVLPDNASFSSRYCSDFEQLERLGHGGYGVVFTARNRLDDCEYAVKRIPLKNSELAMEKAMREVKALAKLDHASIVRYYQAWFENPPAGWQEEHDRLDELSSLPPPIGASDFVSRDNVDDPLSASAYATEQRTGAQEGSTVSRFAGGVNRGFISSGDLGGRRFNYDDSDVPRGGASSVAGDTNRTVGEDRTENYWVTFEPPALTTPQNAGARAVADDDNTASMDIVFGNARCTCRRKTNDVEAPASDVTTDGDVVFEEESKCAECTRYSVLSEKSCSKANRPSSAGDSHRHGNGNAPSPNGSAVGSHGDDKKARRPRLPRLFLYIQMQLCRRESLRDWLQQHVDRDRALSLSIFEQIVVAVDYVHSHGLMHRDLKPSNIFFTMDWRVKVGDFGLATASEEQPADTDGLDTDAAAGGQGQHTNQVGTRLYMSPEQEAGRPYTHKVDIYSLGLIFVEIFSPCATQMERTVTLQNAKLLRFPAPFQAMTDEYEFVLPLLSPDPDKRPSTSDILRHKLLGDFEVAREAYTRLHSKVVPSLSESSLSQSS